MKKGIYFAPSLILLLFVLAGGFVSADQLGDPCTDNAVCQAGLGADGVCLGADPARGIEGSCFLSTPQGPQTAGEVLQIIENVGNWVFAFFLAISLIFLIWGAFEFVIGQGEPQKISDAKQRLLWAVIGIAIALLANAVPYVLRSILV
tara:strand:- start:68 stop:511 length:444 start_codon:yes stop_codon:yes gene_type:complete